MQINNLSNTSMSRINQRSWINIDLTAFSENIHELKKFLLPNQNFLQVVKADAYGHGAFQIAKAALECGAAILGVANVEEALYLRYQNITAPILVLSPSLESEIDMLIEYDIIPSVSEIEFCNSLDKKAKSMNKQVRVHIKIDTGMNRTGIKYNHLKDFYDNISKYKNVLIEGLFSHFASSDDDDDFSIEQYERFLKCLKVFISDQYKHINHSLKYTHIANSVAIVSTHLFHNKLSNYINMKCPNDTIKQNKNSVSHLFSPLNLVRIGIMSYGYSTIENLDKKIKLKPIMSFHANVSHIKNAFANETIGYNRTYTVDKDLKYAIIPVGYADGYDYLLSNKAHVLIKGVLCPVLGRISMDMLCVDVSAISDLKLYEETLLLGSQNECISATYLASLYKGSVYELLCQLGRRAKRYYYQNSQLIDNEPLQRRSFIPIDFNTKKLNNVIQQAIAHRVNSNEISSVVYNDILKNIFWNSDRDISHRSNFNHSIEFFEHHNTDYYKVKTSLSYNKILKNKDFTIVCANDNEKLQYYFKQKKCEYRWLLDKNLDVINDNFSITTMSVRLLASNDTHTKNNGELLKLKTANFQDALSPKESIINLNSNCTNPSLRNGCLIYKFNHPLLKTFCGQEVTFFLETETLYPKKSHQLSVYINEITKGINVRFTFPKSIGNVETTVIFSGKERFPEVKEYDIDKKICCQKDQPFGRTSIEVKTKYDTWIFPNSGIIFSF